LSGRSIIEGDVTEVYAMDALEVAEQEFTSSIVELEDGLDGELAEGSFVIRQGQRTGVT